MLRKFGNIITMCLLLVSTTGFSISEHFCGSKLISVEINKEAEPCCDNGMCCHTDTQFFQMDEDFNFTISVLDFQVYGVSDVPQISAFLQPDLTAQVKERHLFPDFESPPPLDRQEFLSTVQTYLL